MCFLSAEGEEIYYILFRDVLLASSVWIKTKEITAVRYLLAVLVKPLQKIVKKLCRGKCFYLLDIGCLFIHHKVQV